MDGPAFLAKVDRYRQDGFRLVMVNATAVARVGDGDSGGGGGGGGAIELTWSFEKAGQLEHVRELVTQEDEVPSVTSFFPSAYLAENEMRELFGVRMTGLSVDLGGQLYQTSTKVPFSAKAIRARLEERRGKKP
jgi:hypothetical protein